MIDGEIAEANTKINAINYLIMDTGIVADLSGALKIVEYNPNLKDEVIQKIQKSIENTQSIADGDAVWTSPSDYDIVAAIFNESSVEVIKSDEITTKGMIYITPQNTERSIDFSAILKYACFTLL